MKELKRKPAEDDIYSFLVGGCDGLEGGDVEAETLTEEFGGTTSRVLKNKAATPQKAPNGGPSQGQARA